LINKSPEEKTSFPAMISPLMFSGTLYGSSWVAFFFAVSAMALILPFNNSAKAHLKNPK
jgi:hypothetical protein